MAAPGLGSPLWCWGDLHGVGLLRIPLSAWCGWTDGRVEVANVNREGAAPKPWDAGGLALPCVPSGSIVVMTMIIILCFFFPTKESDSIRHEDRERLPGAARPDRAGEERMVNELKMGGK